MGTGTTSKCREMEWQHSGLTFSDSDGARIEKMMLYLLETFAREIMKTSPATVENVAV